MNSLGAAETGDLDRYGEWIMGLRFPAKAGRLRLARALSGAVSQSCGCGQRMEDDIVLAVDEACQNVIRHAYRGEQGDIAIDVWRGDDRMVFRIRDFADPVNVADIEPRSLDELRPGGLGTHLMREVMDDIVYQPAPPGETGNVLILIKYLGKGSAEA